MADTPMKTTLDVKSDGIDYVFGIPSLFDEIKIGNRVATLRRAALGPDEPDPGAGGIDGTTLQYLRGCAVFELLLQKCSDKWPYSAGPNGPVVNSKVWAPEHANKAMNAYWEYCAQLDSFRAGGNPDQPPADGQVVAGSPADAG